MPADLMVRLNVTEDITSSGGFSIQLNTFAPPGLAVGAMQYTIEFLPIGTIFSFPDAYQISADYQGWACPNPPACKEVFGTPTGWDSQPPVQVIRPTPFLREAVSGSSLAPTRLARSLE